MNLTGFYQVAVLALATSAISVTISKARLFASLREWIASRNEWLGDLVSCSYCTSHWVAIALIAIYRPVLVPQWMPLDFLVSVFGVVAIAAVISGLITKLNPFLESVQDKPVHEISQLRAALEAARGKLIEQNRIIREFQQK